MTTLLLSHPPRLVVPIKKYYSMLPLLSMEGTELSGAM